MSKLYDGFRSSEEAVTKWYLKINEDMVYGPIPLATLCDWAAQGRVAAGNLVSQDEKIWIPAETVLDLKMDWLVELKNGEKYGPFNLLAAPYLVNRGIIKANDTLQNKTS